MRAREGLLLRERETPVLINFLKSRNLDGCQGIGGGVGGWGDTQTLHMCSAPFCGGTAALGSWGRSERRDGNTAGMSKEVRREVPILSSPRVPKSGETDEKYQQL